MLCYWLHLHRVGWPLGHYEPCLRSCTDLLDICSTLCFIYLSIFWSLSSQLSSCPAFFTNLGSRSFWFSSWDCFSFSLSFHDLYVSVCTWFMSKNEYFYSHTPSLYLRIMIEMLSFRNTDCSMPQPYFCLVTIFLFPFFALVRFSISHVWVLFPMNPSRASSFTVVGLFNLFPFTPTMSPT